MIHVTVALVLAHLRLAAARQLLTMFYVKVLTTNYSSRQLQYSTQLTRYLLDERNVKNGLNKTSQPGPLLW